MPYLQNGRHSGNSKQKLERVEYNADLSQVVTQQNQTTGFKRTKDKAIAYLSSTDRTATNTHANLQEICLATPQNTFKKSTGGNPVIFLKNSPKVTGRIPQDLKFE